MIKTTVSADEQMIFRNEKDGRVFYNTSLSRKDKDGNWENGSISIQFKKSVELADKTKIAIKDAWISFYKDSSGKTVPFIFCNDFEIVA